ncbi:MAG: hypothetical protein OEW75_02890 [Cyclobacteriaceae bacterium]|nr:hypothetical protein [Cyclobacteriaceae bacterium]
MRIILITLFISITTGLRGQIFDAKFNQVYAYDSLPKKLLTTKSTVFIDMATDNPKEWDRVTQAFHLEISKSGIDAVAYYNLKLVFSGEDVLQSYIEDFENREISNLIFVKYAGENSAIFVTSLDKPFLTSNVNIAGWKREGNFKEITRSLYVQSSNSGFERSNFLLNTVPEKGPLTNPIKGKSSLFFSINLKTNKLAVPKTGNLQRDFLLENSLKEHYPFEFELVDNSIPEDELLKLGFNFILRYIEAPQDELRNLLGYSSKEGVTHYMAVKRRGSESSMVPVSLTQDATKFYIKDLRKGDAYLGTEWDIDTSWIDALINHIYSFKEKTGS